MKLLKLIKSKSVKFINPFFATTVVSVFVSISVFYGFSVLNFNRLARSAFTASVIGIFQTDLPEGVSPFYKMPSFSGLSPSDANVVGIPTLTLRDRILLNEQSGEVMVALYNRDRQHEEPYLSHKIGNGNETNYIAGDYGIGNFTVVTTQTTDCFNKLLPDCLVSPDKIAEWRYKVVADTFTYILAPIEKGLFAKINAEKAMKDVIEKEKDVPSKNIIEMIKEIIISLIKNSTSDTADDTTSAEDPSQKTSGFQILPASGLEQAAPQATSTEIVTPEATSPESISETLMEAPAPI